MYKLVVLEDEISVSGKPKYLLFFFVIGWWYVLTVVKQILTPAERIFIYQLFCYADMQGFIISIL